MGMFDYVRFQGQNFQTKDTDDQFLHQFYIEKGRLLRSEGHREDRSKRGVWVLENPGKTVPAELDHLSAMGGCACWVETHKADVNFHGVLNFYNGDHEYHAKFTDGDLEELTDTDRDPPETTHFKKGVPINSQAVSHLV